MVDPRATISLLNYQKHFQFKFFYKKIYERKNQARYIHGRFPNFKNIKLVDISVSLDAEFASDPPGFRPKIKYLKHQETVESMTSFFPGLKGTDLPNGEAWAIEELHCITHNGTHLDAPYHFASTMDSGERAITIDEVPLEWCFAPAVKLDFRNFEDGYIVQASDVENELEKLNYQIQPLDIVVVNTSAGMKYGQESYVTSGCGMGFEATMFLLKKGVRLTGTDAWSWDAPFKYQAERYAKDQNAKAIWEGHKAGLKKGYCHLEKLSSLELLPSHGFWISCFPFKIRGASAGFTRAVAFVQDI